MKFEIAATNLDKMNTWLQAHIPSCSYWQPENVERNAGTGVITYAFTPTSTGLLIEAQCKCGQKTDITDYGQRDI